MDFVSGRELKWYQANRYPLDEKTIIKWMSQLLEVLTYLHSQTPKIIHGDIKPANIMVTEKMDICLIDFNISLGDGDLSTLLGISEAYAAPEQIEKAKLVKQGKPNQMIQLDDRTDLYCLGKSFYTQMQYGQSCGIVYSDTLWEIVGKSMQEDPRQRYQSAAKMNDVLKNIEKYDKEYRKYYFSGLGVHCGYAVCLVFAALLIYFGYGVRGKEQYQEAYQKLNRYVEAGLADDMVMQGMNVLNQPHFNRVKRKEPEEAAEIFHAVGDGYYLKEEYQEAAEYYAQAIELMPQKTGEWESYYVDYGISLARDGQAVQAGEAAGEAGAQGASEEYTQLIYSEIYLAEGKEENAAGVLQNLTETSQINEITVRAWMQLADIYEDMGEMQSAVSCIESAREKLNDPGLTRRLGRLYYSKGQEKKAAECFKKLIDTNQGFYEDYINYAVCCETAGNYSGAIAGLQKMTQEYPEKYEAYMHMAFSYYRLGKKATAKEYYQEADEFYRAAAMQDNMMEELKELFAAD